MKKIAALIVLILFMVNTMGFYIVFRYNQFVIRREMMAMIMHGEGSGKIVVLRITENDKNFRRIDKEEFAYHGKMYDMVSEDTRGDTTIFYCLHDKKEEELVARYTLYLRHSGGSPVKDNQVLAMLHSLISHALIQNPSLAALRPATDFNYQVLNTDLIPVYLAQKAPPPKSA